MSSLAEGDALPRFSLPTTNDQTISEKDFIGKISVLYFYPKDATPGCTQEGKDFRDLYDAFLDCNAQIFGVSRDSVVSHEKFKAKQGFPFELISDEESLLCDAMGVVKPKSMFGKTFLGIVRTTFLIDTNGKIAKIWPKVKVTGHAQEVLEAAQSLA